MPRRTDLRPPREHRQNRRPPHVVRGWVRLSGPAGPLPVGAWRRLRKARGDGGLCAPPAAVVEAGVRRWVRIWSVTDGWVLNATRRLGPRHAGHAKGVDLEDLLQQRRPATGDLGRLESCRAGDCRTSPSTVS